ncbi:MAG: ATP-binding protein [Elusimicrobia bacterium]|nr:ATP-binding protein [Elusimicrobiota bacterium]
MSLFNRLLTIVFGIGLIPIIPTAIFLFYYQSVAKNDILALHENISDMASVMVRRDFKDVDKKLYEITSSKEKIQPKRDKKKLDEFLKDNPQFLLAGFLDSKGKEIIKSSTAEMKRRFGFLDFSEDSVFLNAKNLKKTAIGNFEIIDDLPICSIVSPIKETKEHFIGVLDLKGMLLDLSNQRIGDSGRIYISDFEGNLFNFNKDIPDIGPGELKKFFESGKKSSDYILSNKFIYIGSFSEIPEFNTAVITLGKRGEAFHGINLITSLILFFLLAIATVFYFSALFFSRKLINPVQELMQGAKRVSAKNFKIPVKEKSDFKEFSSLMKSFNAMMKDVNKYQDMQVEKIIEEKRKVDLLMSLMQDAVVLADSNGVPLYANKIAKNILDIEDNIGDGIEGHQDKIGFGRLKIRDIIKMKTKSDIIAMDSGQKGEKKYYRVNIKQLKSKTQDPCIFMIMRDITLEHEIGKIKEDFFHSIAHDIRVPLLTMQGYIKLLENSCEPGMKNSNYIENIKSSSNHLFELLQNILDISRIEAGNLKPDFAEVKIAEFLTDITEKFKVLYNEKKIKFELVLKNIGKTLIKGDENLLRRVIENLLSNALKFTPVGGRVEFLCLKNKDILEISVSDNGRGIPEDKLGLIFEKYVQVSENDDRRAGSGLGLAIAKKIIEMHGGNIYAESVPDKGSVFKIEIDGAFI